MSCASDWAGKAPKSRPMSSVSSTLFAIGGIRVRRRGHGADLRKIGRRGVGIIGTRLHIRRNIDSSRIMARVEANAVHQPPKNYSQGPVIVIMYRPVRTFGLRHVWSLSRRQPGPSRRHPKAPQQLRGRWECGRLFPLPAPCVMQRRLSPRIG